jgi:oligopeptidase A
MQNPLLANTLLPAFSQIIPNQHIQPAITEIINQNQSQLNKLLAQTQPFSWDNLMAPLDDMDDVFSKAWSPVSHLHGVNETDELREAYNACLPLITAYHTEFMQNTQLFEAIQSIADSADFNNLNAGQQKVINNALRDFKLSGVNLSDTDKATFGELQHQLSQLTTKFGENVLDATQGWTLHIEDATQLAGLPQQHIDIAAQTAQQHDKTGWLFTLEHPSYAAIMKFLDNRDLRQQMYTAYCTRASDQGPTAGQWDNAPVMEDILKIRHQMAKLLGFNNYAEYSLAIKMAESPNRVLTFLNDLVQQSKLAAERDIAELREFGLQLSNLDNLESWDYAYFTEKMRQEKYDISQEELKPYFPADHVLSGMFKIVNTLYGLTITEKTGVDVWHEDAKYFEVTDQNNQPRGSFYTDLFARQHKRGGAWMDECRIRRRLADGSIQQPVAYLTCNFTPAIKGSPALLTQDEVETLFHEFGHCLHHMLTQIEYASISGINGVAWDAVEFPSQIMEHWCWEKEAMAVISKHVETGETLPDALYDKLRAAKNFQSGMHTRVQLEYALFDFHIHLDYDPKVGGRIQAILDDVREQVAVTRPPKFNRFQNTFSHIFAGSYAAGYYSYKWAEVLSSDAFSLFEETGTFNSNTGRAFMHTILEQGGLPNPMDAFIAFRGREPQIDALLRHSGLIEEVSP